MPCCARSRSQHRELGLRPHDRRDHPAGQTAVRDLEPVGLDHVEADVAPDPLGQRHEAARDQAGDRAHRAHRADQGARPRHQARPLAMDLLEDRLRQPRQQRDPGLERQAEGELAAHGAPGDRRDLGLDADQVGQLVDRLDRDDGRIQVAQQQALGAMRRPARRRRRSPDPPTLGAGERERVLRVATPSPPARRPRRRPASAARAPSARPSRVTSAGRASRARLCDQADHVIHGVTVSRTRCAAGKPRRPA